MDIVKTIPPELAKGFRPGEYHYDMDSFEWVDPAGMNAESMTLLYWLNNSLTKQEKKYIEWAKAEAKRNVRSVRNVRQPSPEFEIHHIEPDDAVPWTVRYANAVNKAIDEHRVSRAIDSINVSEFASAVDEYVVINTEYDYVIITSLQIIKSATRASHGLGTYIIRKNAVQDYASTIDPELAIKRGMSYHDYLPIIKRITLIERKVDLRRILEQANLGIFLRRDFHIEAIANSIESGGWGGPVDFDAIYDVAYHQAEGFATRINVIIENLEVGNERDEYDATERWVADDPTRPTRLGRISRKRKVQGEYWCAIIWLYPKELEKDGWQSYRVDELPQVYPVDYYKALDYIVNNYANISKNKI